MENFTVVMIQSLNKNYKISLVNQIITLNISFDHGIILLNYHEIRACKKIIWIILFY
jgi:hypothetical protein